MAEKQKCSDLKKFQAGSPLESSAHRLFFFKTKKGGPLRFFSPDKP
jgi:hypothetical protein